MTVVVVGMLVKYYTFKSIIQSILKLFSFRILFPWWWFVGLNQGMVKAWVYNVCDVYNYYYCCLHTFWKNYFTSFLLISCCVYPNFYSNLSCFVYTLLPTPYRVILKYRSNVLNWRWRPDWMNVWCVVSSGDYNNAWYGLCGWYP